MASGKVDQLASGVSEDIDRLAENKDIEGLLALAQKALDDTRELLKQKKGDELHGAD